MLNLISIKTKKGFYVSEGKSEDKKFSYTSLDSYVFDGKSPEKTFKPQWIFLKKIPKHIQIFQKQPDIKTRYELINKNLTSNKIPLVIEYAELELDEDDEWIGFFSGLKTLYEFKSEPQPPKLTDVEFSFTVIMELDEIKEWNGFSFPAETRSLGIGTKTYNVTEKDVEYQILDEILFPNIVLAARPCKLSSKQSYDIVRNFVKTHINSRYAVVTSDYDFCFTVEKRIERFEPLEYLVEIGTGRRKHTEKRYNISRTVKVFEMTYSPENYKGYTPIKGFVGDNWEDLSRKVISFCEDLVNTLNEPIKDCPHCKGTGVSLDK